MSLTNYIYFLVPTYLFTSFIFFLFPNLLRKPKENQLKIVQNAINNNKIIKIAHRGGPRYTVQNTIQGFRKVVICSDMLQMDVCQTKDKMLIVHHDHSLLRTFGIDDDIRNYNYKDLPSFKSEIQLDFADNLTIKSKGEKVPTLQEVFKQFPNIPMNIELKTPSETSLKELPKLIKKYQRTQNTIVGIRSSLHKAFKQENPQIRTFMTDSDVYRALLGYFTFLLPFMHFDDCTLQIPIYTNDFYQRKIQTSTNPLKVKLFFMVVRFLNFTTKPLIWHFKRRNIGTFYWVCNNDLQFRKAERSGVCGIMTDVPLLLNQYLKVSQKQKVL